MTFEPSPIQEKSLFSKEGFFSLFHNKNKLKEARYLQLFLEHHKTHLSTFTTCEDIYEAKNRVKYIQQVHPSSNKYPLIEHLFFEVQNALDIKKNAIIEDIINSLDETLIIFSEDLAKKSVNRELIHILSLLPNQPTLSDLYFFGDYPLSTLYNEKKFHARLYEEQNKKNFRKELKETIHAMQKKAEELKYIADLLKKESFTHQKAFQAAKRVEAVVCRILRPIDMLKKLYNNINDLIN